MIITRPQYFSEVFFCYGMIKGFLLAILKVLSMFKSLNNYRNSFGGLGLLLFLGGFLPIIIFMQTQEDKLTELFMIHFIIYLLMTLVLTIVILQKSRSIEPKEYLNMTSDLALSRTIFAILLYAGFNFGMFYLSFSVW